MQYVIENAAQAIGAEYKGRRAGSMGHLGCFSFFPSKNLGGAGDGGMVVTNDPQLAQRIRLLRSHGAMPKYHHRVVGGNFRLDAIQAAVLRVKYLEKGIQARRNNAATYRRLFQESGLASDRQTTDNHCPALILPYEASYGCHVYNQFVIPSPWRDDLAAYLKGCRIGTEVYYPVPMHLQECFADMGYRHGDFPANEQAARETLALPIYPELSKEMLGNVVNCIAGFYAKTLE
jgi:dTDP-4-amino-4,6-dideoxygalactose transaminase